MPLCQSQALSRPEAGRQRGDLVLNLFTDLDAANDRVSELIALFTARFGVSLPLRSRLLTHPSCCTPQAFMQSKFEQAPIRSVMLSAVGAVYVLPKLLLLAYTSKYSPVVWCFVLPRESFVALLAFIGVDPRRE